MLFRALLALTLTTLPARAAASAPFRADANADVAPGLSLAALHQEASDALASLVSLRPALPPGLYVAIDADPVHPYVVPGCDDDGDAVLVVSDAALKLLEHASYGLALDEAHGTQLLAEYAALLATAQRAGARLVPPGSAFFRDVDAGIERAATLHFRAALGFWLGRAASVHDASEISCVAPNLFREHGDRTWSVAERSVALARAATLGRERDGLRSAWALAGLFALGGNERSSVALASLAQQHPWRGPFALPAPAIVTASARVVRDAATARAQASAAPTASPPAAPTSRLPRRYP